MKVTSFLAIFLALAPFGIHSVALGNSLLRYPQEFAARSEPQNPWYFEEEDFDQQPTKPFLGVSLLGGFAYTGLGGGAQIFFSLGKSLRLGVQFLQASANLSGATFSNARLQESLKFRLRSGNIFFQVAPRKWLYFSGHLDADMIEGSYGFENLDNSTLLSTTFKYQQLRAHAAVGSFFPVNQYLFFNIDWFGYGFPLQNKITIEKNQQLEQIAVFLEGRKPEDRLNSELKEQTKFFLFLLHIGVRF